jgi:SOS-response transcriptional repressor LexA
MDLKLTKRQQEIFDFIKRYSSEHGYPPTVRDIGKAIGLTSSSTVHAHLSNLEKLGLIRRDPTKPRALELLGQAAKKVVVPRACRSSVASRPVSRCWRRRTSRTTSTSRTSRAATPASTSSRSRATR